MSDIDETLKQRGSVYGDFTGELYTKLPQKTIINRLVKFRHIPNVHQSTF